MLLKEKISLTGAGRTDSGVNARNYVAHFDSSNMHNFESDYIIYKTNAILASDIVIYAITAVPENAHARFDAISREYKYMIHTTKDPFASQYSYYYHFPVDLDRMNLAARAFLGRQDFSSLEKLHGGNTNSICEVYEAGWKETSAGHYVFTVRANRFLRNMVRAMVGSLLEVGRGKREPEWIRTMLEAKDRGAAGNSVPGNALFLNKVEYPEPLEELICRIQY